MENNNLTVGTKIKFRADNEIWIVVKNDLSTKSNEIRIKPFCELAKKNNISLSIDIEKSFVLANAEVLNT